MNLLLLTSNHNKEFNVIFFLICRNLGTTKLSCLTLHELEKLESIFEEGLSNVRAAMVKIKKKVIWNEKNLKMLK